jgi:predicted glycoside hydrolase/deacetylase ChbG (UPF0249 family)
LPRLLIVNADDFGLSRGVNEGIIEAHTHGVVTSVSLMVARAGAEHAAELARRHPALSVGLHFEQDDQVDLDDPDQAAQAFARQLGRFRDLIGGDPTHVDSHHHLHAEKERLTVFTELVASLAVPLRHDGRVPYLGGFYGTPDRSSISRDHLLEMIRAEVGEGFTEIGCHPARITGDFESSYLDDRAVELETLTGAGLREEIEASGVKLISYRDWRPGFVAA